MVSRTALIVVTVIVALGLLGPMSYIAQSSSKNGTAPAATPAAAPQAPAVLTPVLHYSAKVPGSITEVEPTLLAVFDTNMTGENLTAAASNLTNATLLSLKPQSNHYAATYKLNSTADAFGVLFALSQHGIGILQYGFPAKVELPPSFTAYRGGRAYKLTIGPADSITGITTSDKPQPANFSLDIVEKAGKKRIMAVEAG